VTVTRQAETGGSEYLMKRLMAFTALGVSWITALSLGKVQQGECKARATRSGIRNRSTDAPLATTGHVGKYVGNLTN
jgi:hypothetical protein